MSNDYDKVEQLELPVSATLIYTSPADKVTIIKHMRFISSSNSAKTYTIWDGGTDDVNLIQNDTTIVKGGSDTHDVNIFLPPNATLYAKASAANSITATFYGIVKPQ